jgi:hypothetical protein
MTMVQLHLNEEGADVHFQVVVQLGGGGGGETDTKVSVFYTHLTYIGSCQLPMDSKFSKNFKH